MWVYTYAMATNKAWSKRQEIPLSASAGQYIKGIDTHFIQRGRFGRISEAVAKFPNLIGIGLAEDTGMIIKKGEDCTIIGSGMAIIFDGNELTHNNEKILKQGTPMTMTNLKIHVLANGDHFNIKTNTVKVLPVESPFI